MTSQDTTSTTSTTNGDDVHPSEFHPCRVRDQGDRATTTATDDNEFNDPKGKNHNDFRHDDDDEYDHHTSNSSHGDCCSGILATLGGIIIGTILGGIVAVLLLLVRVIEIPLHTFHMMKQVIMTTQQEERRRPSFDGFLGLPMRCAVFLTVPIYQSLRLIGIPFCCAWIPLRLIGYTTMTLYNRTHDKAWKDLEGNLRLSSSGRTSVITARILMFSRAYYHTFLDLWLDFASLFPMD